MGSKVLTRYVKRVPLILSIEGTVEPRYNKPLYINEVLSITNNIICPSSSKMLENAIYQRNVYSVDSAIGFPNTYLLNSDLSG